MERLDDQQVVPNFSTAVREPRTPESVMAAVQSLPLHQRIGVLAELDRGSSIAVAVRNTMGGILDNK